MQHLTGNLRKRSVLDADYSLPRVGPLCAHSGHSEPRRLLYRFPESGRSERLR